MKLECGCICGKDSNRTILKCLDIIFYKCLNPLYSHIRTNASEMVIYVMVTDYSKESPWTI